MVSLQRRRRLRCILPGVASSRRYRRNADAAQVSLFAGWSARSPWPRASKLTRRSTPDNLDSHKHENIYEKPITAKATCFSQPVRDKQLWMLDLYLGFFSFFHAQA